ncbi:MAG: hypothetical protein IM650_12185 [Phenylobacterium sp.]|uniref:hypothetical protein n=1 Tax=Bacteria TaxID=2 RepID=UPI00258FDA13|nr:MULTISPECIES: hypothetical protein [Bacteria]MCA3771654.1 hypothetical protein [Cutibacterium sp.]MCA6258839.1 hypothetical protein [Phenylobacterium sp.]
MTANPANGLTPNSIITPQTIWSATAVATTANTTYTDSPTNTVLLAPLYLLNPNPFSVTNGSPTVTVTQASHGLETGDTITIAGAAAVGGITPSGAYQVTVLTSSTFTVTHGSNATSTVASGGGSAVTVQDSRTSRNGARISRITGLTGVTTTAAEAQLFNSFDGGVTKRLVKTALLPAYTIPSATQAQTGADFGYSDSSPYPLAPGETLYIGVSVSGRLIVTAQGYAY